MTKHKVHFFRLALHKDSKRPVGQLFSDICQEIVAVRAADKSVRLGDDTELRLNYFKDQGDYYEGKIVKYRTNQFITGSVHDDELSDFELSNGQKFTEVTHFIYTPQTSILSCEYNQSGPRYTSLIRYINQLESQRKADPHMFMAQLLMHPDVTEQLEHARRIKSLTVTLPVAHIPSQLDQHNLLSGLKAGSKLGDPGQISMTLIGARGRGDRSPLMSVGELMTAINTRELDLSLYGKVSVEMVTDYGADTVNLLENRLESSKEWNTPITNANAQRWFDDIRGFYQANQDVVRRAVEHLDAS